MPMVMDNSSVDIVACPFGAQVDSLGQLDVGIVFVLAHEVRHAECRPNGRIGLVVLSRLLEGLHGAEGVLFQNTDTSFLGPYRR